MKYFFGKFCERTLSGNRKNLSFLQEFPSLFNFFNLISNGKTITVVDAFFFILVIDAVGKLPAGLINGDILWVGDYDECVNITATVYVGPNQTEPTHPFKGRYCKAGIPLRQVGPTPGVEVTISTSL